MKLKCESCTYYKHFEGGDRVRCMSRDVAAINKRFLALDEARKICDKEGDGVFVYFEPRNPGGRGAEATFVQLTRDRSEKPKAMAAGA